MSTKAYDILRVNYFSLFEIERLGQLTSNYSSFLFDTVKAKKFVDVYHKRISKEESSFI